MNIVILFAQLVFIYDGTHCELRINHYLDRLGFVLSNIKYNFYN